MALGVTLVILIALTLWPQKPRINPSGIITLTGAAVTLYPQADPEAVWYFGSDRVNFDPNTSETTLYNIQNARRTVKNKTDFTLLAPEVVIDAEENLRGDNLKAHLVEANWNLDMRGDKNNQVLIDQAQGKFEVPVLDYSGDGIGKSHTQNASMKFDMTNFSAGGPDTIGYNRFIDPGRRP